MPSLQHQLLARAIPVIRRSSEVTDPDAERRAVLAGRRRTRPDPPPRTVRGLALTRDDRPGFPVFSLQPPGPPPARTVLYLHGGGYVGEVDRFHWRYVAGLVRRLGVRVALPAYPLAPEHTWRDAHPPLVELAEQLAIESPQGLVLMGDSAGGGLALALTQQLAARPGPQPTGLVLVSPWVDLTHHTPGTREASARDPWLAWSKLELYASWWAGGDDPARPELSPLFGDLDRLPRTLVLCGTRDTLWPQGAALVRRACEAGAALTYVEEPGLIHVYPILPVPEAGRAREQVVSWLR